MRMSKRIGNEDGAVLILFAFLLPILMILTAGGITGFSLYSTQRELQRAADQAALAGAAALPPADPNVLIEDAPYPLPDAVADFDLTNVDPPEIDPPRMRDIVPDPRTVACRIGSTLLTPEASRALNAFQGERDEGADDPDTVCEDFRVVPRIQTAAGGMTAWECANALVREVSLDQDDLQQTIDGIVEMPLDHVLPAALTPQMRVTTWSHVRPPFLAFLTGDRGITLRAEAVALRRIKNAVVVPILPEQRLLIDLGLADPVDIMTDPQNLNRALDEHQPTLIEAIDAIDGMLNDQMSMLGLPCNSLLHNLRRDLHDIYDPPTGPAPSARDIVDDAIETAERAAARLGIPDPDPDNPDSLAGETFVLIGVTVDDSMELVSGLQVPILDVVLVTMHKASSEECPDLDSALECHEAAVTSAANAHGAFRASLIR